MARKNNNNKQKFVVLAERTVFFKTTILADAVDEAKQVAKAYSENATAWEQLGTGWRVTHVLKEPKQ